MGMDGIHDLGGMHGFGAVVTPGAEAAYQRRWEGRVFALSLLADIEGLGAGPGRRVLREEMDPAHYLEASYYERSLWAIERRLERKGTIRPGEVERMMERLRGAPPGDDPHREDPGRGRRALEVLRRPEPMATVDGRAHFAAGDRVRARRMRHRPHTRCPRYVRGAVGVVDRVQGMDVLPELSAYGEEGPLEPVYAVRFASEALFGRDGLPHWSVVVDLWESYLEEPGDDG
jgi:nitrile hydratase